MASPLTTRMALKIVGFVLAMASGAAFAHVGGCGDKDGVEKLRCERHLKIFDKCGVLKGDEHFQCDRDFLVKNPLDCSSLKGDEKAKCEKEVAAFKTCETNQGREFMRCVQKNSGASPMGH